MRRGEVNAPTPNQLSRISLRFICIEKPQLGHLACCISSSDTSNASPVRHLFCSFNVAQLNARLRPLWGSFLFFGFGLQTAHQTRQTGGALSFMRFVEIFVLARCARCYRSDTAPPHETHRPPGPHPESHAHQRYSPPPRDGRVKYIRIIDIKFHHCINSMSEYHFKRYLRQS